MNHSFLKITFALMCLVSIAMAQQEASPEGRQLHSKNEWLTVQKMAPVWSNVVNRLHTNLISAARGREYSVSNHLDFTSMLTPYVTNQIEADFGHGPKLVHHPTVFLISRISLGTNWQCTTRLSAEVWGMSGILPVRLQVEGSRGNSLDLEMLARPEEPLRARLKLFKGRRQGILKADIGTAIDEFFAAEINATPN